MNTNRNCRNRIFTVAMLAVIALALSLSHAMAYSRIIPFLLVNETSQTVTFEIVPLDCYEGTGVGVFDDGVRRPLTLTSVQPGGSVRMILAREQNGSCDGRGGHFGIWPQDSREIQYFEFSNDGFLFMEHSNVFSGVLTSVVSGDTQFYTWRMRSAGTPRLAAPVDERLTMPRNYIAYDSGRWERLTAINGTTHLEYLQFATSPQFNGSRYFSCFGNEFFHPQHVQRLPNKDGCAYFMVAQSWKHNGYIYLVKSNPGVLDPVTDLLRPSANGSPIGNIIWQDDYRGSFAGNDNPIGNWNHPGKMALVGGVLLVAAQNWSEGLGADGCTHSTSNPYQRGSSEDAVLFYDVRDPERPRYWGKMTAQDLKLPPFEYLNGTDGSGRGGTARQLSELSLIRVPETEEWQLRVGIYKSPTARFTFWKTSVISPYIKDWTQIVGGLPGSGEHGSEFSSYQWDYQWSVDLSPTNGIERNKTFDISNGRFTFLPPQIGGHEYWMSLPGPSRNWDADSIYVTRQGVPIVYSVENAAWPDGSRGTSDAYILQIYDSRNRFANQTPHPVNSRVATNKDPGVGSLRRAIGYGGNITFDAALDGATIALSAGPLIVSLHDINIDASALAQGITIRGNGLAPAIQVTAGNILTMNGIKTSNDPLAIALNAESLPWATGGSGNWFSQSSTTHDGARAARSGAISGTQETYIQSAVTGPGTLTFWWKVSSEANFDWLRFELDGVQQPAATRIAGTVDWQQKTIPIPAGNHQLRWTYSKDLTQSSGSDAGWVDQVVFNRPPPVISGPLSASGTQGLGFVNGISANNSPTSYGATGLPAGLFVNPTTGAINGSPAVSGTFTVNLFASNEGGTGTGVLILTVAPTAILVGHALEIPDQPIGIFSTFFGQAFTTHDGVDAVQSAATGNSYLDSNLYGPGTLTFWWKVSSQAGGASYLEFYLDDVLQTGIGDVDWQQVTVPIPAGQHGMRWMFFKDGGGASITDAGWIDQVTFVPTIANALDTPAIPWTTSGSANWIGQTRTTHPTTAWQDQRDATQSGAISDSQESVLETTVTGPGSLSFWWKVSSEINYDFLSFHLDGAGQSAAPPISGDVDWEQRTVSIPAGPHTLRWTYSKDSSVSELADTGWLDQVLMTPGHPIISPLAVSAAVGTPFSYQITAPHAPTSFAASLDPLNLDTFPRPMPPGLSLLNGGLISGTPTAPGIFEVMISASSFREWGTGSATLVLTVGPSAIANAAALDATNLTWTTHGDGTWFGQTVTAHDSMDAARSSSIGDLQETALETTLMGPGMLTFWWKVSSEENRDFLRFTVDDAQLPGAPQISGEVDWQQRTVSIAAGSHTLIWTYLKDGADSAGSDGGWVDEVVFISSLVTNTTGSGPGSLRQVIADLPAGATIRFDTALSGQTLTLGGSELLIANDLTIDASGLNNGITISGGGAHRIFSVNPGASLTLRSLTLAGGDAGGGFSGGAVFGDVNSVLNLDRCTLTGNNAVQGGALFNLGTMTLSQCTLTGNSGGYGGAVQCLGLTTITHCTIAGNDAYASGGIYNKNTTLTLESSIVAANTASIDGRDVINENATLVYSGTNLVQSVASAASGSVTGPAALNAAPLLAPLGNYGGPTQTMPPLTGSPAIDAGGTTPLTTDQRGWARLVGSAVDIGAVEFQVPVVIVTDRPVLTGLTRLATGEFRFSFTNLTGARFGVFTSTNLALPLNAWSEFGPLLETPPGSGQFQFIDAPGTNSPQRFYRVFSW